MSTRKDCNCIACIRREGERQVPMSTGREQSATCKVRITLTDAMGKKKVYEDEFSPMEKTASIAAKDLIEGIALRDGDTLEVAFPS